MAGIKKRIDIFLNGQQAGQTIGNLYKTTRKLRNEINGLTPGTAAYNAKVKELASANAVLDKHRAKIRGIKGGFQSLTSGIGSAIKAFGPLAAGAAIVGGIVSGVRNWIDVNMRLEKSLSSLKSLTGASAEDLKVYKEAAIDIGSSTTLSATQTVDAFKTVGSARPELLKNRDALIEVTKEAVTLAEASEMEMKPATEAMIGIMNQFGLANSDAARTANVLAAGSKAGAAGIDLLAQATDKSGTVAAGYNVSLEENVGLLEALAEKNLTGAEAGTKLRNVLLNMQTVEALPPEALAQLEKFGVDTELVADKTVPFQQRLEEMSKIAGDATAMTKVFGKENQVAASILLNATDTVENYTKAVTGTNTAQEQAAINTDNLDGDLKGLSSAWEGLNLILGESMNFLRPMVQWLTNAIKWVSELITVFKEMDSLKIENMFLKIQKSMFVGNAEAKRFLELQIRINELAGEVIDEISDEARQIDILTTSLAQNNDMLENANLTEEQAAKLRQQNADIIADLTSAYPDLTAEIDWQTASYQELSVLQQQITDNMVKQAIEAAKVAEQERLLNQIIENSIEIAKTRAAADNGEKLSISEAFELSSQMEEIDNAKFQLENFTETFEEVENTINGMNLNYGQDFDANTGLILEAQRQMDEFNKALENASTEAEKLAIEAQIEAGRKLLEQSTNIRQDQINDILNSRKAANDELLESEEALENAMTEATVKGTGKRSKLAEDARKKAKKAAEDLQKELEKIIEKTNQLQQDAANQSALNSAGDEESKAIVQLEIELAKKYDKEIEAARRLATEKGIIGEQAAEQLATLEALKTAELEEEKAAIRDKFKKERIDAAIEENNHLIELAINAERTKHELAVAEAANALNNISDYNVVQRAQAWEEYKDAKINQANWELEQEQDLLVQKFANEEINEAEFYDRKEQLEKEHQDRINKIAIDAAKQRRDEILNDANQVLEAAQKGIQLIGQFREAEYNNEMALIDQTKNDAIKALEEEKRKGLITEKEYQAKKMAIDQKADRDQAYLKEKAARAEKNAAVAQALINGALAATKVLATYVPPNPLIAFALGTIALQTAANVAVIKSQPIPQYFEGGMHQVKGAKDGKNYNARFLGRHGGGMLPSSPSLILASEHGSEYFVPNHLLDNPQVANYVRIIEAIRTNQMAAGGFTNQTNPSNGEVPASDTTAMSGLIAQNTAVLMKLTAKMDHITAKLPASEVDKITEMQSQMAEIRG